MLRVLIDDATEGMRLAVPVLHPKGGNVLLREGYVLDRRLIWKLQELEVHEFWIEYPGAAEIRQFVSPTVCRRQTQITTMLANSLEHVQRSGAGAAIRLDFADYRSAIRELIEELIADPTASAYVVEMAGSPCNVLRHCSEVSFLSIALGLKLRDYLIAQRPRLSARDAVNVVNLGLGALLHDVGYLSLTPEAQDGGAEYFSPGPEPMAPCESSVSGLPEWQSHVSIGHKMLSGSIRPSAAGVVLQHHQHFDGSGFPRDVGIGPASARPGMVDARSRGLMGEEIHVFARIACVANHFDRLRRPRMGGGRARPRVRVLRDMLLSPLRRRFDPVVLAALPSVAPAYQPGSVVKLSNGESAVVVDWKPAHPCRPTVQVIAEDEIQSARYDLHEIRELTIVEHEGCEVSKDNFELPPELLKRAGAAALNAASQASVRDDRQDMQAA